MTLPAQKDKSTVNSDGVSKQQLIDGVLVRRATTQTDERGTVCEILNPAWGFQTDPIVYVYQITIRPHIVKGWHAHHTHDDRLFISLGTLKVVLYDDRPDSPTYQMINEVYLTELERTIIVIPRYVFHALQNVGTTDALVVSMPTSAYNHEDPDVFRLPVNNDFIPYCFEECAGW